MGADLIGYLLKGPEKIEMSNEQRSTAEVKFQRAQEFAQAYQEWEEAEDPIAQDTAEQKMADAWEYVKNFSSNYDEPDLFFGHFISLEADLGEFSRIDDWIDWWNRGCPARDVNCRLDPDDKTKQIVFSGDMSWGDSPDGFGYRMFEWLDLLDWYGCFGIQ